LLDSVLDAGNVDAAWNSWKHLVEQQILQTIPYHYKTYKPHSKPWFTAMHHKLRRRRDRLFVTAKRSGAVEAWAAYRIARNALTEAIRRTKRDFFRKVSANLEDGRGSYHWWRSIKSICNLGKPKPTIPDLVNSARTAKEDIDKADMLCKLFASYSQALSSPQAPSLVRPHGTDSMFSFSQLETVEVFKSIKRLPNYKSTAGLLSNAVLRRIAPAIAESLTALFNRSIQSSSFPAPYRC